MMTDGCTLWPDKFLNISWAHCCDAHDIAYRIGVERWQADRNLQICVEQATGSSAFAAIMFIGVALFGWMFYKQPNPTKS